VMDHWKSALEIPYFRLPMNLNCGYPSFFYTRIFVNSR
jgi:hypothetical protein